jgi:hypothetical protein
MYTTFGVFDLGRDAPRFFFQNLARPGQLDATLDFAQKAQSSRVSNSLIASVVLHAN